jgi:sugar phosphate isomerase/epimerase
MKLAVSTYSLSRWRHERKRTLEQALEWLAEVDVPGVRGVEFAGLDERAESIGPVRRAGQLRRRCERLGLAVVGYCVGANLLVRRQRQQEVVERLKRDVDTAAALGAPLLRHDVTTGWTDAEGLAGPRTFAQALKVVVPAVREVAEYARTQGVVSSLENHGFYMQASARVERLIRAVDHANYGLTVDMGNFLCVNEDPVAALRRVVRYVVHAHVKDFHVRPKRRMPPSGWFATPTPIALRGAIVGHGEIDIPAQLKILVRAGYQGYLSLEFEGIEEPAQAVRLGLEYVHAQLKALGALAS